MQVFKTGVSTGVSHMHREKQVPGRSTARSKSFLLRVQSVAINSTKKAVANRKKPKYKMLALSDSN